MLLGQVALGDIIGDVCEHDGDIGDVAEHDGGDGDGHDVHNVIVDGQKLSRWERFFTSEKVLLGHDF